MEQATIPQRKSRKFITGELDPGKWESIEPYLKSLLDRQINSVEELRQWLKDWDEVDVALVENNRWIYVRTTVDTTDEKAKADQVNLYKNIYPRLSAYENQLSKKFVSCPYTEQLDKNLFFTTVRRAKKQIELFREENIPLQSELNLKQSRYDEITGSQSIVYNGSEITFQQAAVYLEGTDRKQREEVFKLIAQRRLKDAEELDQLMTDLVKLRHQIAVNAGYKNFRDYRFADLGRFDYTPEDCERFHEAVSQTVVPLINKLAEERKAKLGFDTLRPYDLDVDISGKPALKPVKNTDELVEKTITCFNRLDPYFGERISIMQRMNYLDLESRMHKGPGGYNMTMPEIGVPFIFMNSANNEHDLITMVHEGGHAVHTFLADKLELNAFKEATSEISEVASMAMELMSMEHWDIFYTNPDDLQRARRNHFKYILTVLSKTCLGDSFQHWLYTNPDHTVQQRRDKWVELSKKFTANIDWSGYEETYRTGYQRILHFYVVPFYYIEYAFAQLGSLDIWRNFRQNPTKTVQNYKNALSLGYTQPIPVFYETAGTKFDFSKQHVAGLVQLIEKEISE